jgi:hypothetical protein
MRLFAVRLCQAACTRENIGQRSGAQLETTMVNFLSFHNPNPGAFFFFEIVTRYHLMNAT